MSTQIEKELKLEPKPEIQAKLLAISSGELTTASESDIKEILKLEDFILSSPKKAILIDEYFDTKDFDLKSIGAGMRIRKQGRALWFTLKKQHGEEGVGERSWLETTKKVSSQEVNALIKSNFNKEIRNVFPELANKTFQKTLSLENERVTYGLTRGSEIYELALDCYRYTYPERIKNQTYYELEIEAESDSARSNLSRFKQLVDQGLRDFTFAHGNKYSRGIETAINHKGLWGENFKATSLKKLALVGSIASILGLLIAIVTLF